MTNKSIRDYINLIENAQREDVAEGSEMIWIVYRQETTLYPSGERDHETEIVKTFTNDNEAEAYADKLNSTNRDEDVYYFVRGKKQGVAEAKSDDPDYDESLKRFKKGLPPKKKSAAEEQLEETTPDALAKIDDLFRK